MTEPYILKLLGGVSLAGPDGPLEGPVVQHRRLALLALLATTRNGPVSRDKLIATLWPQSPAESARHSLSDAIHVLRKALGGPAIVAAGDGLRLDPKVVGSDVTAFEAAVDSGDLERAVELYGGPFLDGFFISGAVGFDDWAAAERERLARVYAGVVERLAEECAARGDPRSAARWWARRSAHDPYDARVAVRLMEVLAAAGDRGGAIQHGLTHAALLRRELDTEPDPVVTELARRLRQEPVPWTRPEGLSIPPDDKPTKPTDRKVAWVGSAALVLAVLGSWAFWPRPEANLTPEEALAAGVDPGIAVLPFTVNEPSLDRWREGMVDLLSVNLDGVPDLRAIDNRTVLARWGEAVPDSARADLATALAVARQTGARYALLGTVVTAGPNLRLTAEVYETRGDAKLGRAQVVGSPDSILVLVDRLTMEILRALPREGSVLADVDLAELTTNSLDALKAYLSGEALYRRADFKAAATAYELAIASDSLFALAWDALFRTCGWSSGSPSLCPRDPPGWPDEFLRRLPARKAEMIRADVQAEDVNFDQGPMMGVEARREMVRKYPDDPHAWFQLGDVYTHNGGWVLVDRAEGDRALEHAIALAPTMSAEPYIHLIEHAFADADSARIARLLESYERLALGTATYNPAVFRLAFTLGFGDPAARARSRTALDTVPAPVLAAAISHLGNPRLHDTSEEALRVLLARPDYGEDWWSAFLIFYRRGTLRAALNTANDPVIRPAVRAALTYRLHQVGVSLPRGELERVLAAGAADTTPGLGWNSTFLLLGAYAVDRGNWGEYAIALDRQRRRARSYLANGNSRSAFRHEGAARAIEGYALWKRGQKEDAVHTLEAAQWQIYGGNEPQRGWPFFGPNVTVRWWLGDLMLEVGRPRDAERYFKSISADPFVALRLGKVYEELGEREKARASYEYALLSWQDADPELQPLIQEARRALDRLGRPHR